MSLVDDLRSEWYDSSKLTTYNVCPRKYYFRFERNLIKKGDTQTPLVFGTAFHSALESLYRGQGLAAATQSFLERFPEEAEGGDRTRVAGQRLLAAYAAKWRNENFNLVSEPEQAFHFPIDDWEYVGRIDLLVVDPEGVIRPMDHKTTTRFGQQFELGFKVDVQITGYIVGARRLTNSRVTEAIINAVRITSKISDESFARKFTTRLQWEIDEWFDEVRGIVSRIRESRKTNKWPKHAPEACFSYNSVCPYFGICLSRDKESVIETSYKEEIWEPV